MVRKIAKRASLLERASTHDKPCYARRTCADTSCKFVGYVHCARQVQMRCACLGLCLRSALTRQGRNIVAVYIAHSNPICEDNMQKSNSMTGFAPLDLCSFSARHRHT